ncbi:ABC transporter substrate-binding protein [Flavitalea sp. BT771]|uniref:ABC transporter substrate-binding protein n=1 Tax=Flavitalea sp. BT771 TaxID=3063329 RepID=UPI0026E3311C|nr:ABC transporter substrate-binding protein [Flavitalea sp. BT771]MDO6434219.1 ABC transporter substrate-binding protein [Flavitalea sp. BT771]MDV6223119.1 ABC transporter substrate-binding protein [Flavitalea sp. BT771]
MPKNQQLKLGWLFPYSGIFTHLKKDLQQGLALGWGDGRGDIVLAPHPAFIQTGSLRDTEDALKKLLLYDEVDLVMGVVSTKVARSIIPLLEQRRTPLLLLNLGADIPTSDLQSPYLLYNSLHLWKSQWAIGRWAQKKYGGEPAINLSIYEAGYSLHETFKAGVAAAGAETVKLNIVKNFAPLPDVRPLIQYLIAQQPAHAHALLSGKEGELFLRLFNEQGLHSKIALTVNPFIVEDGLPSGITDGTAMHNAITWSRDLDTVANRQFVEGYQARFDEYPHAFTLLAYEAGLALAAAVQTIPGKIDGASLANALENARPTGPRGKLSLSTRPLQTQMPVYIRQSVIAPAADQHPNKIIEILTGIEWNAPSLITQQPFSSGWQNPYLCV